MRHILLICFWFCLVQAQERFFFNRSPFTVQNNAKTTVITVNASPTCYEPAAILTDCRKKKEMGFLFDPILYYQDASPFGLYHQPYQAVRIQPSIAPLQLGAARYVDYDLTQSVENKEKTSDISPSLNSVNEFPDTSGRFLFVYSTMTTTLTATAMGQATQTLVVGCLPPGGEIPKPYCLISFNAILPNGVTLQQMCYAIGVAAQMKTTCILIGRSLDLSKREARQIGVRFKITFEQLPGGNPPSRGLISRNLISSFILSGNLYTLIGLGGIFNPLDFVVPGFDNIYAAAAKPVPCILKSTLQCGTGETCKATTGLCDCSTGYVRNPITNICNDIDECLATTSSCSDPNSICANTIGSFKCGCKPGFVTDGVKCIDVDECLADTSCKTADPNSKCNNLPGTKECICIDGYKKDAKGVCQDVDECLTDTSCKTADLNSKCNNLPGTKECICQDGYKKDVVKGVCLDVDECLTDTSCKMADPNSKCNNLPGTKECICLDGYKKDAKGVCIDFDACKPTDPCKKDYSLSACKDDLPPSSSYTCTCTTVGFKVNDVTKQCEDIDECLTTPSPCLDVNSICANTVGLFTCNCKPGFTKDTGGICVDVDECSVVPSSCASKTNFKCVNTIGSYTCDTCQTGYQLKDANTCEDVDECLLPNFCGPDAAIVTCTKSPGISTCVCMDPSTVYDNVQKNCFGKCTVDTDCVIDMVSFGKGFCGSNGQCSCEKGVTPTGSCA